MIIRIATSKDAEAIQQIYAPYVLSSPATFETEIPSVLETEKRITGLLKRYPYYVAEVDGKVVGYCYACEHRSRQAYRWSVDVAVYVNPQQQRNGVAKKLYSNLFETLQAQGFYNAYAGITMNNAASIAFHESFGFSLVGVYRRVGYKLGSWHDVGWWELLLRADSMEPKEPVPFSEF